MDDSASLAKALAYLDGLSVEARDAVARDAMAATSDLVWVPNRGPQLAAMESEADELFFGGQAGGGKTDLVCGLALTKHERSLLLRRYNGDARALAERACAIRGTTDGYNQMLLRIRHGERLIEFAGCQFESDKQRFKGSPHDFYGFDEIGDFLEAQYRFIIAWNRSATPGQRVRVVCTGNPPTEAEGLWVIQYWAPWLDPKHPYPARPGELRWYTFGPDGRDMEVEGRGPHMVNGEKVYARSRTFIPSRLDDNPDLTQNRDYQSQLDALPAKYRAAYRDGNFNASLRDDPEQMIPTAWIVEAQKRWNPRPLDGVPMCAIGVDVAGGGTDDNVVAQRYDGWYAPLMVVRGVDVPMGTDMAARILAVRKNGATVCIDCGGGYGAQTFGVLRDNDVDVHAYRGAEASLARTTGSNLTFSNRRAEVWWRFREALDPDQPFGSPIALPDDPILLSDLASGRYDVKSRGVTMEDAKATKKRLGRSPDRGVAVVLCWWQGLRNVSYQMHVGDNAEHRLKRAQRHQTTANFARGRVPLSHRLSVRRVD